MKSKIIIVLAVSLLSIILIASCGGASSTPAPAVQQATAQQAAPAAEQSTAQPAASGALDGKALVEERCTACHAIGRIQAAHKDGAGWKTTVERMVGKGAKLNADEQAAAIKYLAETYK